MDLQRSIVAILNNKNDIVGTGFVAGENLILTCAHVVEIASDGLNKHVKVRFKADCSETIAWVEQQSFSPSYERDVALLRVVSLPQDVKPLPLASASGSAGHDFYAYGYAVVTDVQGIGARGKIVDIVDSNRLVQLISQEPDHGMSGGPVFDEQRRVVIGMISKGKSILDKGQNLRNTQTTFAISMQTILGVCNQMSALHIQKESKDSPKLIGYLRKLYDFIDSECNISFQTFLEIPSSDTPNAIVPDFKFDYIASPIHRGKERLRNNTISSSIENRTFSNFTEAFDYHQNRVLLLGLPGSGKTTTLLHFTRQAILDRLADPQKPIPIWANIGAWDLTTPLRDWIEKPTFGAIPKEYPRLYLLDGLDEIMQENDKNTLEARSSFIQQFNEQIKDEQVVITCRISDYYNISTKIDLAGAITLNELSNAQIQKYLIQSGSQRIINKISKDKELLKLVRTPLMLSLLIIAYGNGSDNSIINSKTISEWQIFDRFFKERILHETEKYNLSFSEKDIKKFLGKLAIKRDGIGNVSFRSHFSKEDGINVMDGSEKLFTLCYQMQFLSKTYSGVYKFTHLKLRDYFAIDPLINIIKSERQGGKGFAAYAFEKIGTMATTVLINLLANEDNQVREKILWALGSIRDERAIPSIIKLLSDDDAFIRWYAIEALSLIGNESVVDYLIIMLDNDEPDPNVRGSLAIALGKFGSEKAIPVLRETLDDEETRVSDAAAGALEEIGSEKALRVLERWVSGRKDR
ncbi:PBS lyase HEAT-like repeat [Longilinea arvoryzae]|uniref:PBS lyase HEAT-like repeat n=1 Tax=Longilinea arvoryzae TaxID=360412 RepID=A0A0S7BI62_9CHLR|nr:HEAT repeat domain-containing protein [Longilinea arvoryzae]GAP13826.1 PBS lyase HEAT-like repeat [Longilinea arvoryzae]